MRARIRKISLIGLLILLLPFAVAHIGLRASLPPLDGDITAGVSTPVSIERDALGTPTITAATRDDLAYATGFVHAQDRLFQMDLSRRLAAGELSELFGPLAVPQDKRARIFRFRQVGRQVIEQAPTEHRAILAAYARGVNAGIESLRSRPWEYWVLGVSPRPWRDEDTILVAYAMWWDLQYSGFRREMFRRTLNERLRGPDCGGGWKCSLKFFYPPSTEWDAPMLADEPASKTLTSQRSDDIPIPGAEIIDVRGAGVPASVTEARKREPLAGSNNWAVAGRLTQNGSALVANDMHLRLRIPPVWYRARLKLSGSAAPLDVNGLTLPGAPLIVAGSNGHIAWGFTNSYGDWLDIKPAQCLTITDSEMRTPEGVLPLSAASETIHVRGGEDVVFPVRSSPAGVLFDVDVVQQRCWFATWLAQQPAATNLNLVEFERTTSVQQALALAPRIGIPHQNLIIGDREGHIGWTVLGRIPVAAGEGRTNGQSEWRTAPEYPQLVDPAVARLWSANARPTDDPAWQEAIAGDEATVGAEYDLGARARQIREGLLAMQGKATPADMLRVQLDDRAVFLSRWRDQLLVLLDDAAVSGHSRRAVFKRVISNWDARAATDSAAYLRVRTFHDETEGAVWQMILQALGGGLEEPPPSQFEAPLWKLVTEQPMHMLAASYPSWRDFLLEQVDRTIARLDPPCDGLDQCTWPSEPVHIRHPLSDALPFLSPLIDMPALQLPGDHDMPRVQDGAFGASERFAVTPGHEDEGYLHIPGGQSGHPLSPFYRRGFQEWADGKPLPFLPGPVEHRLVLQPR